MVARVVEVARIVHRGGGASADGRKRDSDDGLCCGDNCGGDAVILEVVRWWTGRCGGEGGSELAFGAETRGAGVGDGIAGVGSGIGCKGCWWWLCSSIVGASNDDESKKRVTVLVVPNIASKIRIYK